MLCIIRDSVILQHQNWIIVGTMQNYASSGHFFFVWVEYEIATQTIAMMTSVLRAI